MPRPALRPLACAALALAGACADPAPAPPAAEIAPAPVIAPPPAPTAAVVPAAFTGACPAAEGDAITLFTAPRHPRPGVPLRVMAVSEEPLDARLSIRDAAGAEIAAGAERHGGPPFWWYADVSMPAAGAIRGALQRADGSLARCREVAIEADPPADRDRAWGAAWGVRAAWTRGLEGLYSAWIEKLFDAPLAEQPSWPALHEVLRDRDRNLLHDYLGQGEDDAGPKAITIDPDCADLPYFLRAYFAFKLGLPFGYSSCTRGGGGQPPRCLKWHGNLEPARQRATPIATFGDFLRVALADTVHSGTGRTPADDGDYYPVPLTAASLRPGTVYADPYGHVLVVAKRIPQAEGAAGVLLAVDGQPDGTVSRKRFWRGNFLFAQDPTLGSPGFKRFRPVVLEGRRMRALDNRVIAASPAYGDVSTEQDGLGVEGFYDRMDDVLSPSPLDPARALVESVLALEEQVKARVRSLENGEKHWAAGGARIDMPDGAAIFETTGPWEDFSTPSRDLRLLIAIDVVRTFPDRVARRPERFAMPAGKAVDEVKAELAARLAAELGGRTFQYARSDGSSVTLSLADVVARAEALEVAYNPNDCVEIRWGAAEGSAEASTCRRRASGGQRARMRRYRPWFHERRRPPRGG